MLVAAVEGVVKTYRGRTALNGVDLTLPNGVTCVLGRNGAGKSTLARIIVGVEEPSSGRVTMKMGGDELTGSRRFAHIGWLPQSFGYPSRMRVREFVSYAAWLKKVPKGASAAAVDDALAATDLAESAEQRLGELSGGTLRRAGLAAAIVHGPGLLVLDEPTAGLDPVQRAEFHSRIAEIGQTTSVLLATHLLEDVQALAASVSVLDQGRMVWHGTTTELAATVGDAAVTVDSLRSGLLGMIGVERA